MVCAIYAGNVGDLSISARPRIVVDRNPWRSSLIANSRPPSGSQAYRRDPLGDDNTA